METNSGKIALKSGIWYTVANFMARGVGFITMPIFTRLMTKSDIGDISNFTSWLTILTSIITLDLHTSVTVAKFDYRDKLNQFISSILVLGSLTTTIFFILTLPFKDKLMELLSINLLEYYLLFLTPLFSPAIQMIQIKNRLDYKYKLSVILSLGSTILSAFGGVICVLLFQDKLTGRLLGSFSLPLLLNIIIYIFLIVRGFNVDIKYWKYALNISLPLIVHVLAGQLLSSCDRLMITNICGEESNAMYSVAYSCSMVVSILWTSMNTAWSPWAYEQMDKQNYAALKRASRPYLLFFGFVVFCFLMIAPEILLFMGGNEYTSSINVIPPVMVAFVFQFVYSLYVNIETFNKKQKYIAIGTCVAAVLNIVLNFIFIPIFGYTVAAYTTLAGYVVLFLIHFFFVQRLGKTFWYDTKFNIVFLVVFLALMIIVNLLYMNDNVRYIIICFLMLFIFFAMCWLRKEILHLIRKKDINPLINKVKLFKK